jgi:hypothetical protein
MANPTTNYGFVLPTSTDLVTDLPADFDVALQGVDTRLKALQPGTTLGDLAYSSSTANTNTRLPIGTSNQVLTVSGGVPAWVTPAAAGGGKILQVVSAVTTTETNIASTSMTDTTITATITPTASTSKIMVLITASTYLYVGSGTGRNVSAQILRGATNVYNRSANGYEIKNLQPNTGSWLAQEYGNSYALAVVDSPATTSATTYKLQAKIDSTAGSSSIYFQLSSNPSTIILMEIGA